MKLTTINDNRILQNTIKTLKNLMLNNFNITENDSKNDEDIYLSDNGLIEWLASNNIRLTGMPPSARGSQGVVYFLGDKVLKISNDSTEAKLAEMLKGDKVVSTIDVYQIKQGVWGILQQAW